MRVVAYKKEHARAWDDFVGRSPSATFLLQRGYMDYHAGRFADASLLFFDDCERLCGLLAANACREKKCIEAHGGLTYGGLIGDERRTTVSVMRMLAAAAAHYRAQGYETMRYKPVPYIYHAQPAQEDLYTLFRTDAALASRAVATVIDLSADCAYSELRKRKIKKAQRAGVRVAEVGDESHWRAFHAVLTAVLRDRHGVSPVHSADELLLLAGRFPKNIRLFVATTDNVCAGLVAYDTKRVFHLQYLASDDRGCAIGALDALIDYAIHTARAERCRYFDFGISTEQGGRLLNRGLIFQKEGFGGHAVCYDAYTVNLDKLAHLCI